jgi:outer membrane murein-binding lipoprotein Lpp
MSVSEPQKINDDQVISFEDIRLYIGSAALENIRLAGQVKALKEEINRLAADNHDLAARLRQAEMNLLKAQGKQIIDGGAGEG